MNDFTLTDALLLGSGGLFGFVVSDTQPLAGAIAGVGFAAGVLAKTAGATADVLCSIERAEQDRDTLLHGWAQREAERPRDGLVRS